MSQLANLIAADSIRELLNPKGVAEVMSDYRSVGQNPGQPAVILTLVPGIIEPVFDEQTGELLEAKIEVTLPNGVITEALLDPDEPVVSRLTAGERFTSFPTAEGNYVALWRNDAAGTVKMLYEATLGAIQAGQQIIGTDSGGILNSHPTNPEVRPLGPPSPKAGDVFTVRGFEWEVEDVLEEPDRFTSLFTARRGSAR